jgi:hypothetical protein
MAKLTALDRAIAALDVKIAALQIARNELVAQQKPVLRTPPKRVAPRQVVGDAAS